MNTILRRLNAAIRPPRSYALPADLEWVGIRNVTRSARAWNLLRHYPVQRYRQRAYRRHFAELLCGQGELTRPPVALRDGLALDTTRQWPHLDRLLAEVNAYIDRRAHTVAGEPDRAFTRDIFRYQDFDQCPAILDFILSPDILKTVCDYLGFIPLLSATVPPGVRLMESVADGQPCAGYVNSQLYHTDLHDSPMVYVIVLPRDVTPQAGPFTVVGAAASARVARALDYKSRGRPFYVPDETLYRHVDRRDVLELACPAGTVLFMDNSRCFHFGSRDCAVPRYQLMYAFVSACRTDFTESLYPSRTYPVRAGDSDLRRMVLQKFYRSGS